MSRGPESPEKFRYLLLPRDVCWRVQLCLALVPALQVTVLTLNLSSDLGVELPSGVGGAGFTPGCSKTCGNRKSVWGCWGQQLGILIAGPRAGAAPALVVTPRVCVCAKVRAGSPTATW